MKVNLNVLACITVALGMWVGLTSWPTFAQAPVKVECGQSVDGAFTPEGKEERHRYQIEGEAGGRFVIRAESRAGKYQNLKLDLRLEAPNGYVIWDYEFHNHWEWDDTTRQWSTDPLSVSGTYVLEVKGYSETGSPYVVFFSCVQPNGDVLSGHHTVQAAACGSIVDNEFLPNEAYHNYYFNLNTGDQTSITAKSSAGAYQNLKLDVALVAPNYNVIQDFEFHNYWEWDDTTREVVTAPLPVGGTYHLVLKGATETGSRYTLSIGCTLADGTVVAPGDVMPVTVGAASPPPTVAPATTFSGYGFPGVSPRDFTKTLDIPIALGQSFNGALGSSGDEVFAYTYQATAGAPATLTLHRISGDLSLGVAVISKKDSSILLLAGMPASGSLSATLDFPNDGSYVIGVFRLDLAPNAMSTSGAFEVRLD
jgi:hypothetical protein